MSGLSCVTILSLVHVVLFFFSSRRRHTRCLSDWSSDVCSSDLAFGTRPSTTSTPGRAVRGQNEERKCSVCQAGASIDSCKFMPRSEERRVGKECRSRWSPYH